MRKFKAKPGRHAEKHDRELAQQWVDLYWHASNSPDERVCLNPDDAEEDQQFLYYCDPEPLLRAMQGFADHGTFEFKDEIGISNFLLIHDYKALLADGKKPKQAVGELVERYSKSSRTIQRDLQKFTSKQKKSAVKKDGKSVKDV